MSLIRPKSYQVLITPLVNKNTYGTTVNVTKDVVIDDYVKETGISSIQREVDNGDFDLGIFVFNSIKLSCLNFDGKFADQNDYRTMFKWGRDKAKVTVNFFDGVSNTPSLSFNGLIDDRASKMDFGKNEIKLTVLSLDSILNRTKIPSGTVGNGILASAAIKNILQNSDVTSVLVYDESEINVLNDFTVDVGTYFDNKTIKSGLDELLLLTNSVLVVDKNTNVMMVRSREHNNSTVKKFYGHGDFFGRENIIDIKNYNNGLQRAFNTITIGNISRSDLGSIDQYGDNPKEFLFEFITNDETKAAFAAAMVSYWATPKIELELEVKTDEAKNLTFFDLVSIDYPYRVKPYGNSKLPFYGSARYGSAVYPYIFGNLKISPNVAFKVIGLKEDAKTFLTVVKLRQVGSTIDDGYLPKVGTYYGSAIYGQSEYQEDINRINPNIRSHYGAAKYGTVIYGNGA